MEQQGELFPEDKLLRELQEYLVRMINSTGEVITEYHWRDAAYLEMRLREKYNLPLIG